MRSLLHLQTFDPRVGRRAAEDHQVADPPQRALGGSAVHHGDDRLGAGLGRTRHVVRERAGVLDLEPRDVADGEAKHPPQRHHAPEAQVSEAAEAADAAHLPEDDEKREEEERGVDIVVEGQLPDVAVHRWHHLLGVDGVH